MRISVNENPNCTESEQFHFNELEGARAIKGIRVDERGREIFCDVVGVKKDGGFVAASAVKVADSGAGFAYLIVGGEWGIRMRPETYGGEAWDLTNRHQWGEPFKLYEGEDIVFAEDSR